MSLFDDLRPLAGELFETFGAPEAIVTRTIAAPMTRADRVAGRKTKTTTTHSTRAIKKTVSKKGDDGVRYTVTEAIVLGDVQIGDTIKIGSITYSVTAVDEIDPDGTGVIIRLASLK